MSSLAMSSLANMQFQQAIRSFSAGASLAKDLGDLPRAQRFLNALGGSYLNIYQYRKALNTYEEARRLARQSGAVEVEAVIDLNLTSLYILLGDVDSARREMDAARRCLPANSRYWASLYASQARLALRTGDSLEIERAAGAGLDIADATGNAEARAALVEDLGLLDMQSGKLEQAEESLLEAYRLRRLHRLRDIEPVLCALARLAVKQGQPERAVWLAKLALASRRYSASSASPWLGDFTLAQCLAAAGKHQEALDSYQNALQTARTWRQEIVPSPEIQLLANIGIYQIASAYSSLAAELSQKDSSKELAWRAMVVIEQTRDASFRTKSDPKLADDPDYQETLAQWRAQQFWRMSNDGAERHPEGQAALAIEARLRALENRGDGSSAHGPNLEGLLGLARLQESLAPGDALLSFSLMEGRSWLWAVTRDSFDLVPLAGREELLKPLAYFSNTIRRGSVDEADPGCELYKMLLGALPETVRSRQRWLLSMDDALLEVPLAALRSKSGADGRYLLQDHVLEPLASALTLVEPRTPVRSSSLFLGIGDPVYNLADARWRPGTRKAAPRESLLQLPRLPGSNEELARISRLWDGGDRNSRMLTGFDATPEQLAGAIAARPKVIHLAVHLVQEEADSRGFILMRQGPSASSPVRAQRSSEMFLMLSMRPDGRADGLTVRSIGAFRLPGSLVVMSGCGSGLGTHQPGAGPAGFFKSWIAAGASGVVGTLWSIPDDASALFDVFYSSIREGIEPSIALREAQLALLNRGGWNSKPSFWSAWTTVGRN